MTTATETSTRDYYQAKIERARSKGRKTSHHRARYADHYQGEMNSKLAAKAASFTSLTALLIWALTRDHRRQPLGKAFMVLKQWAAHAGFTPQATIAELKRLHKAGRVEYTGGKHSWDRGMWHPIHQGPKRDLGRIECRLLQVDEHTWEASTEVDGNGCNAFGRTPKDAKRELAHVLSTCGLTGTLTK